MPWWARQNPHTITLRNINMDMVQLLLTDNPSAGCEACSRRSGIRRTLRVHNRDGTHTTTEQELCDDCVDAVRRCKWLAHISIFSFWSHQIRCTLFNSKLHIQSKHQLSYRSALRSVPVHQRRSTTEPRCYLRSYFYLMISMGINRKIIISMSVLSVKYTVLL